MEPTGWVPGAARPQVRVLGGERRKSGRKLHEERVKATSRGLLVRHSTAPPSRRHERGAFLGRGAKNLVTLSLYVAGIIFSSFGEEGGAASSPLVCVPLGPGVGGGGGGWNESTCPLPSADH